MTRAERIAGYLEERIAAGDFPSAAFVSRERGRETVCVARGHAVVEPERIEATETTVYDLASLTKPLATTLLFAIEMEAGRVSLDDPVSAWLAEMDRDDKRAIALRHLLTHTSGLPAWAPFYIRAAEPSRLVETIAAMELAYETGSRVVYSDPNFILLGCVLERVAGRSLDRLFTERVAAPLGLRDTGYLPVAPKARIAASETGNEYERRLAGDEAEGYEGWRAGVIWGEAHDGNAYFMGGVSGHAGLFGTAREVAVVAEQFLDGSRLLVREQTLALFRRSFTAGLEEERSIGWMLAATRDSSAGEAMPADAFGHAGFTGTSVWVDPHAARVNVLLTNRTHPAYGAPPLTEIRRRLNALAAAG